MQDMCPSGREAVCPSAGPVSLSAATHISILALGVPLSQDGTVQEKPGVFLHEIWVPRGFLKSKTSINTSSLWGRQVTLDTDSSQPHAVLRYVKDYSEGQKIKFTLFRCNLKKSVSLTALLGLVGMQGDRIQPQMDPCRVGSRRELWQDWREGQQWFTWCFFLFSKGRCHTIIFWKKQSLREGLDVLRSDRNGKLRVCVGGGGGRGGVGRRRKRALSVTVGSVSE